MKIGIDFDNTIACYDGVFYAAAEELGLVPAGLGQTKNDVRDYLNGRGQKDAFTELQGTVYGKRMDLAVPYPGIVEFIDNARAAGHEIYLVSHKSRYPILGEQHDLHAAARGFLKFHEILRAGRLEEDKTFFEEKKEKKIARIIEIGCEVFIDDLPEILTWEGLRENLVRVLFDPAGHHRSAFANLIHCESWSDVREHVLGG